MPTTWEWIMGSTLQLAEQAGGPHPLWIQSRSTRGCPCVHQEDPDDEARRHRLGEAQDDGDRALNNDSPHIGSSFESWLEEEGFREEATAAAIKAVLAFQLSAAMAEKRISKTALAGQMNTSRAQIDRLLDPDNSGVTLETLQKAAKAVGRTLRLELI
jgi:DNA-binding Xre family transcriptional regulator